MTNVPMNVATLKGAIEKATMPSIEYINSFVNDHLVLPAALSILGYDIHFVLNPTHGKIPFENRLYSSMLVIALTIFFVIILKSRAPSTIFVSDILFITL